MTYGNIYVLIIQLKKIYKSDKNIPNGILIGQITHSFLKQRSD